MASCPSRASHWLAPLLLLAPATAQWRSLPVTSAPPPRGDFHLVQHPDGGMLLFGGAAAQPNASEWRWTGAEWFPTTTPVPRRDQPALAWNPQDGSLLVFGGRSATGQWLQDTWRLDANGWQQLPATLPVASTGASSLCAEPGTDHYVLATLTGAGLASYRLVAGQWQAVAAALPVAATHCQLVADEVRGRVCAAILLPTEFQLLGLQEPAQNPAWVPLGGVAGNFADLLATSDTQRGRIVCLAQAAGGLPTTYAFDGLRLRDESPTSAPPALPANARALAFDRARAETLLVQGGTAFRNFAYSSRPAAFATSYGTTCVDPQVRLDLATGDLPVLGARHRLVAPAVGAAFPVVLIGLSHTFDTAPLPRALPSSPANCQQRVAILTTQLFGPGQAVSLQFFVPNATSFLGMRYDAQAVYVDGGGVVEASNGIELQIGLPPAENLLREDFVDDRQRDALASGDRWQNGAVTPAALGGDGRHGSFDPRIGTLIAQDHFEWNTDNQLIPAQSTLSGVAELVSDGVFQFTDFVLPAGVIVDFVGSQPARLLVRGQVQVAGQLRSNGAAMTTFNARGAVNNPQPFIDGQPGGRPGAGGGRGGNGGNECRGTGPILVNGVNVTDGQPGEDVQLLAGHGYAAQSAQTGGRGSPLHPASGTNAPNSPLISGAYRAFFSPGGGGGGYRGPGGTATTQPLLNLQVAPAPAGGLGFAVLPFPPAGAPAGYSSLQHFLVGGSGGGGGGSHAFGTLNTFGSDIYLAGAGGSGGGGAVAVRAGGNLRVAANAAVEARGGAGAQIRGNDPASQTNTNWGVASPGGGGSGGSILLQSAADLDVAGELRTDGGNGSRTGPVFLSLINAQSQAGAGANGNYRLEARGNLRLTGNTVPAYTPGENDGPLLDRDSHSGSRSRWLLPATSELPYYLRYELLVDVGGQTVLFSDDPRRSALAADDPQGIVYLRWQGAQVDAFTGAVVPSTAGPWRHRLAPGGDSLNRDPAEAVRFDLVLSSSTMPFTVRELRIYWR